MLKMEINTILQTNLNYELINPIELEFFQDYNKINESIKTLSTQNERIARLEEISKRDGENYCSVVRGLVYGILQDLGKTKETLFNYINHINQDGYEFLLISVCRLIEFCHISISNNVYFNLFWLFDKLSHLSSPNLIEFLKLLLRNIYPGVWTPNKIDYYFNLLGLIKLKLQFILSSKQNIASLIFTKILRLYADHHFRVDDMNNIIEEEIFILNKLWMSKKEEILSVGKELIRLIISVSKIQRQEILLIIEEIGKLDYWNLLSSSTSKLVFSPYNQISIPPLIERMLCFLLTDAKRANLNKYMIWMVKKFNITSEGEEESILPDIVRYIITCIQSQNNFPEYPQRWILIGWILKYCKSNVISAEIKQAIFFDWLFFKKDKDSIMLIEPGILVMFCSMREYPEITMELIEFLDLYSENFDLNRKIDIRNCVKNAFVLCESLQIIGSLKTVLLDDKISNDIKKIYEDLTQTHAINIAQTINVQNEIVKQGLQKEYDSLANNNIKEDSFESEPIAQNTKKEEKVKEQNLKKIESDVFIHPDIQKMVSESTISNLMNYRTKQHFSKFLKDFVTKAIQTYTQNNLLESKLMHLHLDPFIHFANFYLTFFKDEVILKIDVEDANFPTKHVSNEIFFYLFQSNHEKSEKEFKILLELIKKIIEKYPVYFNKVLYFIIKKIMSYKPFTNVDKQKNTAKILYKLYINETLKEKFNLFFIICAEGMEFDLINFFLSNGIQFYSDLFLDDNELLLKIIQYADATSINKISNDLYSNKYILLNKNLFKMIELSFDCELNDLKNLWSIILSQRLNQIIPLKDFLRNMYAIIKTLHEKLCNDSKSLLILLNELSKNIYLSLRLNYLTTLNESNSIEIAILFQYPLFFNEMIYNILSLVSSSIKSFPQFLFTLVDEYLSYNNQVFRENINEWTSNIVNLCQNVRKFILQETNNNTRFLFDSNVFSVKNMRIKLDNICKSCGIKIQEEDL